jgi:hypothetical protein
LLEYASNETIDDMVNRNIIPFPFHVALVDIQQKHFLFTWRFCDPDTFAACSFFYIQPPRMESPVYIHASSPFSFNFFSFQASHRCWCCLNTPSTGGAQKRDLRLPLFPPFSLFV